MLNILSTVTTAVTHLTRFLRAPSMWQDTYTKRFKEAHLRIVSTTLASVERVMGIYIGMEWGSRSPALGGSTTPMTSDPNGWAMFGITSSALPHMNSVLATPREGVCCSHVTLCVCIGLLPLVCALTLASSTACSIISTPNTFWADSD